MATIKEQLEGHTSDIITATQKLLEDLSDREGQYVWKRYKNRLPEGYTEVEYIESTGTQYIDTGFVPNNNTRVVMDFELPTSPSGQQVLFGISKSGASYTFMVQGGTTFRTDYYDVDYKFTVDAVGRKTVDKNKETTIFEGDVQSFTNTTFNPQASLYLFARNQTSSGTADSYSAVRGYSCIVYDNGTLAREYVSCINPNGEVGYYDMVEEAFEGNAGTGVFIAGQPVCGEFDGYVTADDANAYPDGGMQDGYWYEMISNPVDLADEADLIAENIREGIDIFGVIGAMSEGVKGVAYGEVTLTSNSNTITAQHNLGVKPTIYGAQIKTLVATGTVFIDREYVFRRNSGTMQVVGAYTPTLSTTSMTIGGGNAFPAGSTVVWYAIAI